MIKTKYWLLLLGLILGACLGYMLFLYSSKREGMRADIYQDGVLVSSVSLSQVTGTKTLTIQCEEGTNVIQYRQGQIRMLRSDCPGQFCVKAGWSSHSAEPIVCPPHKLVVQVVEEDQEGDGIDAISQ
ncbi:MAG: NusG domain II-containing protein [Eubacteriales bacterium]|nr:NusG domain II-containing protein [Eubacteriales bacterium]